MKLEKKNERGGGGGKKVGSIKQKTLKYKRNYVINKALLESNCPRVL